MTPDPEYIRFIADSLTIWDNPIGGAEMLRNVADLIEKLPVTADGVYVVPGMVVYIASEHGLHEILVDRVGENRVEMSKGATRTWAAASDCYSTEAAALAARE